MSALKSIKPKRANSAWQIYSIETLKKLKEKNPALTTKELFTKSAEVWKMLSEKQKEKYVKLAE